MCVQAGQGRKGGCSDLALNWHPCMCVQLSTQAATRPLMCALHSPLPRPSPTDLISYFCVCVTAQRPDGGHLPRGPGHEGTVLRLGLIGGGPVAHSTLQLIKSKLVNTNGESPSQFPAAYL